MVDTIETVLLQYTVYWGNNHNMCYILNKKVLYVTGKYQQIIIFFVGLGRFRVKY